MSAAMICTRCGEYYPVDLGECPRCVSSITQAAHLNRRGRSEGDMADLLQRLSMALDDWTATYCPEFSGPARVIEGNARIKANGGTLAYIASLRQEIRQALLSSANRPTKSE